MIPGRSQETTGVDVIKLFFSLSSLMFVTRLGQEIGAPLRQRDDKLRMSLHAIIFICLKNVLSCSQAGQNFCCRRLDQKLCLLGKNTLAYFAPTFCDERSFNKIDVCRHYC
jgi:hypothetical protein